MAISDCYFSHCHPEPSVAIILHFTLSTIHLHNAVP